MLISPVVQQSSLLFFCFLCHLFSLVLSLKSFSVLLSHICLYLSSANLSTLTPVFFSVSFSNLFPCLVPLSPTVSSSPLSLLLLLPVFSVRHSDKVTEQFVCTSVCVRLPLCLVSSRHSAKRERLDPALRTLCVCAREAFVWLYREQCNMCTAIMADRGGILTFTVANLYMSCWEVVCVCVCTVQIYTPPFTHSLRVTLWDY